MSVLAAADATYASRRRESLLEEKATWIVNISQLKEHGSALRLTANMG